MSWLCTCPLCDFALLLILIGSHVMSQMDLILHLGRDRGELRTQGQDWPGAASSLRYSPEPQHLDHLEGKAGPEKEKPLRGIGEEGRGRGEGWPTKETSCCLHTNPKLIMSGGEGGRGGEMSWQEPLPAEESAQNCGAPPSTTPHSGPSPLTPSCTSAPRTTAGEGKKDLGLVIWPLHPKSQILTLRPHIS